MLVLASTAGSEQAAFRLYAVRAGVNYFHQIGGGIVFIITPDAGFDTVSRQGEGDENHPSVHAADAVSRIGKSVNIQFKLLVVGKRFGVEAFGNGRSHGGGKRLWGGRGNQFAVQIVQQGFRQPGGAQSGAEIARQDSRPRSGLFILILWKNLLLAPDREPRVRDGPPGRFVPAERLEPGRGPEAPFPCWRRRNRSRSARQSDRSGSGAFSWRGFLQLHSDLASE